MISKDLENKIFKIDIIDKLNEIAEINNRIGLCNDGINEYRYLFHSDYHKKSKVIEISKRYYNILDENNVDIKKECISVMNITKNKKIKWWE